MPRRHILLSGDKRMQKRLSGATQVHQTCFPRNWKSQRGDKYKRSHLFRSAVCTAPTSAINGRKQLHFAEPLTQQASKGRFGHRKGETFDRRQLRWSPRAIVSGERHPCNSHPANAVRGWWPLLRYSEQGLAQPHRCTRPREAKLCAGGADGRRDACER